MGVRLRFIYLHVAIAATRARLAIPRPVKTAWAAGRLMAAPTAMTALFLAGVS